MSKIWQKRKKKSEIGQIRVDILLYTKNFCQNFLSWAGRGEGNTIFFSLGLMQGGIREFVCMFVCLFVLFSFFVARWWLLKKWISGPTCHRSLGWKIKKVDPKAPSLGVECQFLKVEYFQGELYKSHHPLLMPFTNKA